MLQSAVFDIVAPYRNIMTSLEMLTDKISFLSFFTSLHLKDEKKSKQIVFKSVENDVQLVTSFEVLFAGKRCAKMDHKKHLLSVFSNCKNADVEYGGKLS